MTERRRTLFIAFAVGNLAVTSAADLMQRPTFLARTDLVHLDVSVLDDQRRPIRGLAASDFTVLEDGEPRDIAAFAAVDVPPPVRTGQWTAEIGSDVQTTEADEDPHGRLFAVVFDDAMMPNDLKMLERAKRIARSVIDHTSGSDQSAVIFTAGSAGAQPFTTDRARLRAAIETLRTGHATYGLGWDTPLWINPPGRWAQSIDGDIGYQSGRGRWYE